MINKLRNNAVRAEEERLEDPNRRRVAEESGNVLGRACRRERAGDGEHHDLLAREDLVGRVRRWAITTHNGHRGRWNLVAYTNSHRAPPCSVRLKMGPNWTRINVDLNRSTASESHAS